MCGLDFDLVARESIIDESLVRLLGKQADNGDQNQAEDHGECAGIERRLEHGGERRTEQDV